MAERPATWRTFATLQELEREGEGEFFTTKRISTIGALEIGDAERELELLELLGAVERREDGEVEYARTDLPVEDTARRLVTLDALTDDERTALERALDRGDVDPKTLYEVEDARDAAQRELGSEQTA